MIRIDFYLIPEAREKARLHFVCRLIEKAYKLRHRIYIHVDNQSEAHALDELLWTYRDDSFLPHHLAGEGPEPAPPIQIGFHTQFTRILEFVTTDPVVQATAREHYKLYRAKGHTINTHQLQATEA